MTTTSDYLHKHRENLAWLKEILHTSGEATVASVARTMGLSARALHALAKRCTAIAILGGVEIPVAARRLALKSADGKPFASRLVMFVAQNLTREAAAELVNILQQYVESEA